MKRKTIALLAGLAVSTAASNAATIASVNFDGRTAVGNTATDLNWTVNGVADPGDISAFRVSDGGAQPLFDGTALVQGLFAPALNTGNANDSWTADIALTPTGGPTVTVGQVRFDYWALSGTPAHQVAIRQADFVVSLLDPDDNLLESASIEEVENWIEDGGGTPVTLNFDTPVDLTEPGTYTLRIQGGNIFNNYTGNHTAIDNLVIAVPEPGVAMLGAVGLIALLRRRR